MHFVAVVDRFNNLAKNASRVSLFQLAMRNDKVHDLDMFAHERQAHTHPTGSEIRSLALLSMAPSPLAQTELSTLVLHKSTIGPAS